MFFKAEMRIKSNTEEFKSSRRKEGACNVYSGWGDIVFRRTGVPMNMISDFCGFN